MYHDCFEQLKPQILNVEMNNWSEVWIFEVDRKQL
jgi:hypothetical protein